MAIPDLHSVLRVLGIGLIMLPLAACDFLADVPPPLSAASEAEKRSYQEIPPLRVTSAPPADASTGQPVAAVPEAPVSLLLQPELLEKIGQELQRLPEFKGKPPRLMLHVYFGHARIRAIVQDPQRADYYDMYIWQQGSWRKDEPYKIPTASFRQHTLPASAVPWRTTARVYQQLLAEQTAMEQPEPIRELTFSMLPHKHHFGAILRSARQNLRLEYSPDGRLLQRQPW